MFGEVETTLKKRAVQLEALRTEIQRYSDLAAVEENKASALIKQIEGTLKRGRGTERLVSFGINVIAGLILFVLGAWLGLKLPGYFGDTQADRPPTHVPLGSTRTPSRS